MCYLWQIFKNNDQTPPSHLKECFIDIQTYTTKPKSVFNSFAITFQSWSLLIIYISPSQDLNKAIITLLSSSLCGGWLWAGSSCAALPQWHPKQKYITLFIISLKKKQTKKTDCSFKQATATLQNKTSSHQVISFKSSNRVSCTDKHQLRVNFSTLCKKIWLKSEVNDSRWIFSCLWASFFFFVSYLGEAEDQRLGEIQRRKERKSL